MATYICVKNGHILVREPAKFYWRGRIFHGLIDKETNALYDDPEDSFMTHVTGTPESLALGLIKRVDDEVDEGAKPCSS